MGDYAPTSVELFDVEGHEREIMEVVSEYEFSTSWDSQYPYRAPELSQVVNGVRFFIGEAHLGLPEEVAPDLEKLGVSFVARQDGYFDTSGEIVMFTPRLGRFFADCDYDGEPYVPYHLADQLVDEARALAANPAAFAKLCIALDKQTGRAWREYFAARRKKIKDAANGQA
jgi:hypothetical protein